jgi:hypothetical protein
MNPHKAVPQTSKDRDWATGIWNPQKCSICDKSINHPIHQKQYIKNPSLYKNKKDKA